MAAPRFITLVAGRMRQLAAIVTSAGAADAEKIPSTNASGVLDPTILNAGTTGNNKVVMTDSGGRLDPSIMPSGFGQDAAALPASEALAAGDLVNIWTDAGTVKARKADATAEGKEAHGFVLASVASAATATVFFEGRITGKTGLVGGSRYYLSGTTPGGVIVAAPAVVGNVVQFIGVAVSTTTIDFEANDPITVA